MSDFQLYLIRYGELGTKSPRIRKDFKNILIQNIERTFLSRDKEVIVEGRHHGRIFAYTQEKNAGFFSRIFGVVSYSKCEEIESIEADLRKIKEEAERFADDIDGQFAVRVKRVGDHEFGSQDIEEELGALILKENPELEVNLDEPDHKFKIEIRHNRAYIIKNGKNGPGGLPLSSQGKVAAYVDDRTDLIATWLMMKRGARPYVYFSDPKWGNKLERWDPNLRKEEVSSLKEMLDKDLPGEIEAIVLGERLPNFSKKEIDTLILRPLIGLTEARIEDIYSNINYLENQYNK